jgi:hypothetical protein
MNRHLNLFTFFNGDKAEFLEDNLSRAFAICLRQDALLLYRLLSLVLDDSDRESVLRGDRANRQIIIDLQQQASGIEDCRKIYAFTASFKEVKFEKSPEYKTYGSMKPIMDLTIQFDDVLLIFEFKRTEESPLFQLHGQVEAVKKANEGTKVEVVYGDFNWGKIIELVEFSQSFRDSSTSENVFSQDFLTFLLARYAEHAPMRPTSKIPFPATSDGEKYKRLHGRLYQIKQYLVEHYGYEQISNKGTYARTSLGVDWGWTREVLIDFLPSEEEHFIRLAIYAGETKGQGWPLYGKGLAFSEFPKVIGEGELVVRPYLKFRHFSSPIAVLYLEKDEMIKTHNLEFHKNHAGKYQRVRWDEFETMLTSIIPGWQSRCPAYESEVRGSQRSYFTFSAGVILELKIPYQKLREVDKGEVKPTADFFQDHIESLKALIDHSHS